MKPKLILKIYFYERKTFFLSQKLGYINLNYFIPHTCVLILMHKLNGSKSLNFLGIKTQKENYIIFNIVLYNRMA